MALSPHGTIYALNHLKGCLAKETEFATFNLSQDEGESGMRGKWKFESEDLLAEDRLIRQAGWSFASGRALSWLSATQAIIQVSGIILIAVAFVR